MKFNKLFKYTGSILLAILMATGINTGSVNGSTQKTTQHINLEQTLPKYTYSSKSLAHLLGYGPNFNFVTEDNSHECNPKYNLISYPEYHINKHSLKVHSDISDPLIWLKKYRPVFNTFNLNNGGAAYAKYQISDKITPHTLTIFEYSNGGNKTGYNKSDFKNTLNYETPSNIKSITYHLHNIKYKSNSKEYSKFVLEPYKSTHYYTDNTNNLRTHTTKISKHFISTHKLILTIINRR